MKAKLNELTLLAVGDLHIDRDEPKTIFAHVRDKLRSADITFGQLEQVCSDKGTPSPLHAVRSDPRNIEAIKDAGFNVISMAGNHTLDWGPEALVDSIKRFQDVGIAIVGVGKNLEEARKPIIVEKKGTKIAFLGYGCVGPDGYEATDDKPGYVPLRSWTLYKQVDYQPGTPPLILTFPWKDDMAAMVKDIKAAKAKADLVVASFHWGIHFVPAIIPTYEFDLGYAAIEAGADLILGHHAHMLKGIEVHDGTVIFHSLGNFALELTPQAISSKLPYFRNVVRKLYPYEADPEYVTYPMHPEAKTTIIAKAIISGKRVNHVSYIPCYVNKKSEPEIVKPSEARGQEVFSYMQKISQNQDLDVSFAWDGDEVSISPKK